MAEVTLHAVVDETHVLRLELPPEIRGEVEVVVRERSAARTGEALLAAMRAVPATKDPSIWREAQDELQRMREED